MSRRRWLGRLGLSGRLVLAGLYDMELCIYPTYLDLTDWTSLDGY